jgi:hypothetical protein
MLGGMRAMLAPLPGAHAAGAQLPLPGAEAALVGLAMTGVVLIPFLWPLADHLDTMAHEGAHAIVAAAVGYTVLGVTLDRDGSGATWILWYRSGPRRLLTAFAGYLGPSAFGLAAARLIQTGHAAAVLPVAVILLVLMLFMIRRSFGVISVPAAIVALAAVIRYARGTPGEIIAYALTWLLLLAGVRTALAHGPNAGDASSLSAMTHLPRRLWALLWIAGTVTAAVIAGAWLIHPPPA